MTKKLHIVADRDIPYLKGVLEPYARVDYLPGSAIGSGDVRTADALLTRTRTRCDRALLDGSPVRLIATATIGHDHIDKEYCRERGIEVATAAGCNARGVLQYVMAALAVLSRQDGWKPGEKTLGVVGVGHVGELIYRYGELFGFRVLGCDPPRLRENPSLPYRPLEELLERCDILSLHVPFAKEGPDATRSLAGEDFFARMRPGTIFINSSRGPVMEDGALLRAIESGKVARAVIDTWNGEPGIDRGLLEAAALGTPHIAGYSRQGKAAGTAAVVRALSRHFSLPLTDWYPPQVEPSRPDESITWEQLEERMPAYFDIEAQSRALKAAPGDFEAMRDEYDFRTEFF